MTRTIWVVTCGEYPKQAYWHEENADNEVMSGDEVCLANHEATEVVIYDDEFILNRNQQIVFDRLKINFSWYGKTVPHALYATLTEDGLPDLSNQEYSEVIQLFSVWLQTELKE